MRYQFNTILLLSALLLLCGLFQPPSLDASDSQKTSLSQLRLFVNLWTETGRALTVEEVKVLNEFLRKDDLVFVHTKHPRTIPTIKKVKRGRIVITAGSYDMLIQSLKVAKSEGVRFEYLFHSLEGFPTHRAPDEEKKNPVEYTRKAKELADANGVGLVISPDHVYLFPYWKEMSKYADIFHLEVQRYQLFSVDEFRRKVKEEVDIIKQANPNVIIFAQLSTNPPTHGRVEGDSYDPGSIKKGGKKKELKSVNPEEILARVEAIQDLVDGVGLLVNEQQDGWRRFIEFLQLMRGGG